MKLKIIALSLLLTGTAQADDVYIYTWETSEGGRSGETQRMYSSDRGLLMEESNSGRAGSEVVILNEGVMIMNDASEQTSMILDPDNLPSLGDLLGGGNSSGGSSSNNRSNSNSGFNTNNGVDPVTVDQISAAMAEANQQFQQAMQDMTPEEREAMNDLLNGGGQLQQQLQQAYQVAMAAATPEERQAMQDLFGGGGTTNNNGGNGAGGLLDSLGGLFGGGNTSNQSSNTDSQDSAGGIASAIGGLFGGGRNNNRSQQSTAQAADDASSSVSSALESIGGLFGGRKELEVDAATTTADANAVVEKDGGLFSGLGNLLGGQSEPPQFTATGNSGRDNGMRWEEVQMTMMGSTSTYRMVNVGDIDGGEQLIGHYQTMTNIYERMMSNMGLGGLMQGLGIWPQEISDYMTQNRKFPIYIEDDNTITRLTDIERGRIDDERFGAQYPVQSLF